MSKVFFAGIIAATLASVSVNAWSTRDCQESAQAQASKVKQCQVDKEFRESVCLQNYYLCKQGSEECLNIFKSCRSSPIDSEKRA